MGREEHATFEVLALWAVGSWARGAPRCGDLDLVMKISLIDGHLPPGATANRVVLNAPAGLRLYLGTPAENSSGAAFDAPVLIWSKTIRDYKAAIASVVVNPGADRFERKTDRLPLRLEQIDAEYSSLEEIIDLIDTNVLESSWVDAASIEPPQLGNWPVDAFEVLARGKGVMGRKTFQLLAPLITVVESRGGQGYWRLDFDEKTAVRKGGLLARLGRPWINVGELDSLSTAEMIFAPHFSKRGPNGFWRVARGPQHQVERQFSDLTISCLTRNGSLFVHRYLSTYYGALSELELFHTETDAQDRANAFRGDYRGKWGTIRLSGTDLLHTIADADMIIVNGERLAVSFEARADEKSSARGDIPQKVFDTLTGISSRTKRGSRRT